MVQFMTEKEGRQIVHELKEMNVSLWRIMKEKGVSYTTVKAWDRGWWNPDDANLHKLFALKIKVKQGR